MLKKTAAIKDVLYEEAKSYFQHETLTHARNGCLYFQYSAKLKKQMTVNKFYLLTSVYFLEKPLMICRYLQNQIQNNDFDWYGFLSILRTIAIYYSGNQEKKNALKKLFTGIAKIQQIKIFLTDELVQSLEYLGIKNIKKAVDVCTSGHQSEQLNRINFLLADQSRGFAQIILAVDLLRRPCEIEALQQIWSRICVIAGRYSLSWVRIFQLVMKTMVNNRLFDYCLFFLRKFIEGMGEFALVSSLLLTISSKFQRGDQLIYRGLIGQLMEEHSLASSKIELPFYQWTLLTLAFLIKYNLVQYCSIAEKLSPSTQFIIFLQHRRVQLHQAIFKQCYIKCLNPQQKQQRHQQQLWGQLILSSKLELLTALIYINDFQHFKVIASKQKILYDYIYHPNLLFAFSELLEWIMDPLYRKIGYARYFKGCSRQKSGFMDGYFKQCSMISSYFVSTIREILNVTRSYIFAKRSTFVKICRLFRAVCQKNELIPVEQSELTVKIVTIIANIIKQYLLPAMQFYNTDPTISNQLNNLLECFMFKVEFQIYHQCFKQRQLVNIHIASIFEQTFSLQNKYINKISQANQGIIAGNMARVMYCHTFSSLAQIFKRITINCKGFAQHISKAVMMTPKLTKKIAFFFIFLQISEKQQSLVRRDSSITVSYSNLIKFAHLLLLKERDNQIYIKILFDYLIYRLKYKKETAGLSVFEFFHGQVQFLSILLTEILSTELSENFISDNRLCLTAGPLLKVKLMQRMNEFNRDRYIRRNIIKIIFDVNLKKILENKFYFILISLNEKMRNIASNKNYNISMHGYLHDQLLKTILNLINLAQLQVSPRQSERYFSVKLFQILVNTYNFPYQLVFQIIRRSIFCNMLYQNYDIWNAGTWEQLKGSFCDALDLYFREKELGVQVFKGLSLAYLKLQDIKDFFRLDVCIFFWVMNGEHLFFRNLYVEHIKQLKVQIEKQRNKTVRAQSQYFLKRLVQQQAQNNKMILLQKAFYSNSGNIADRCDYSPMRLQLLQPQSRNCCQKKRQQFFQYFIKYCILPRVLISNAECFYSSSFVFRLFKFNKTHIVDIVRIVLQIVRSVVSYLPFSTQRQASQMLPLFWNSLLYYFRFWSNRSKMSEKLIQFKLVDEVLHPDDYDEILFLLYEGHTKILEGLMTISNQVYCVKNCLYFLFKSQYIPFCRQHVQKVMGYLEEIKGKFSDAEDVVMQVFRLSEVIRRREETFLSNIKTSIIRRYQQKYQIDPHHQNSSLCKSGNCSSIYKSESRSGVDFLHDYPQLSTTNQYSHRNCLETEGQDRNQVQPQDDLDGISEENQDIENATKKSKSNKQNNLHTLKVDQIG